MLLFGSNANFSLSGNANFEFANVEAYPASLHLPLPPPYSHSSLTHNLMPILNLNWDRDAEALRRLDTSFSTEYVYEQTDDQHEEEEEGIGFGAQFRAAPRVSTFTKAYAITLTRPEVEHSIVAMAGFADDTLREPISLAVVRYEPWNRSAILTDFYVHRPQRSQGHGTMLMNAVIQGVLACKKEHQVHIRHLWLETQNVNYPAIRFYLNNGFRICGWDASLYDEPHADETAVFMVKALA
ncbi:MAG: GNAT family N-acetyltransferase [Candidatus Methylacidiphilales bacterium]|nr:GNAT family N-acetyltransferase [Candidatus Methylacidiphilales bacterium]